MGFGYIGIGIAIGIGIGIDGQSCFRVALHGCGQGEHKVRPYAGGLKADGANLSGLENPTYDGVLVLRESRHMVFGWFRPGF